MIKNEKVIKCIIIILFSIFLFFTGFFTASRKSDKTIQQYRNELSTIRQTNLELTTEIDRSRQTITNIRNTISECQTISTESSGTINELKQQFKQLRKTIQEIYNETEYNNY